MTSNFRNPPLRDPLYRKRAVRMPCMACGAHDESVVLAHINIAGNFGRGINAGDDETVYLCGKCHAEMDQYPGQRDRWLVRNILLPERRAAYRRYKSNTGQS